MKDGFDKSDVRKIVFSDNSEVRKKFNKALSSEIEDFIEVIFKAYGGYKLIDAGSKEDKRKSYVSAFLFNAISNLVNSTSLLISGYLIPSRSLMRHFSESSAMAILLSSRDLNYLERFEKEGNQFPVHKALNYVSRNVDKLKIDRKGWDKFVKIEKFYDSSCHASAFALASILHFYCKGMVSMGSDFDPVKMPEYEKEVKMRIGAANCLVNITVGIRERMINFK